MHNETYCSVNDDGPFLRFASHALWALLGRSKAVKVHKYVPAMYEVQNNQFIEELANGWSVVALRRMAFYGEGRRHKEESLCQCRRGFFSCATPLDERISSAVSYRREAAAAAH